MCPGSGARSQHRGGTNSNVLPVVLSGRLESELRHMGTTLRSILSRNKLQHPRFSIAGSLVISSITHSECSLEDSSLPCSQLRRAYYKRVHYWTQLCFRYNHVNDREDHVDDRQQPGTTICAYADNTTLYKCLPPAHAAAQWHELQVAVDAVNA